MTNMELYDRAGEAILDLYNDKSVSKEEAGANLEALIGEIEILVEALKYS